MAALVVASCAGSRGTREPWVYALSRDLYEPAFEGRRTWLNPPRPDATDDGQALAYVVVLVLPFALDTVLLVVTVPHDLLLVE